MTIDGTCHCGQVRYKAEIDPAKVVVCHCTDCQALSGSAFRVAVATVEGGFTLLAGELSTYVKTAESGNKRQQTFCKTCGSPIYSAALGEGPRVFSLRLGSIRQRRDLVPNDQYWMRSALPWTCDIASIHQRPTQPAFGSTGSFGERE